MGKLEKFEDVSASPKGQPLACPGDRDGKICVVRCNADVKVRLNPKPRVKCDPNKKLKSKFDVELDVNVNPRCRIVPRGVLKDKHGCKHRCLFTVFLDADCDARVVNTPCDRPARNFHLDVKVPVKTDCKIKHVGHRRDDD